MARTPDGGSAQAALEAAVTYHKAGRLAEAERLYRQVLLADPDHPDALYFLGVIAQQSGHADAAADLIRRAMKIAPGNAGAHVTLGNVRMDQDDVSAAADEYRRAIALDGSQATAHGNLATALMRLGRFDDAAGACRRALDIEPGFFPIQATMAAALHALDRPEETLACCEEAVAANPGLAAAHGNLGNALHGVGRLEDAIRCCRRALAIDPNFADAHNNLGMAYLGQGRLDEAGDCFAKALEINPAMAEAHNNLGGVHRERDDLGRAVACFEAALKIDPHLAQAHHNKGDVLKDRRTSDAAIRCFERALELRPENAQFAAHLLRELQQTASWQRIDEIARRVDEQTDIALEHGRKPEEGPFHDVARHADPRRNFLIARAHSRDKAARMAGLRAPYRFAGGAGDGGKITLGYVSCDFHDHATAHLMRGYFGLHDKRRFRVIAYSHGPDDASDYRQRIAADCDSFVDIQGLGHADAADRIHADGVDILIDLKGHTGGNRLEIFALRPAPVQATYLGFPGTTGADFMDYVITDRIVSPADDAPHYSEALVHLPHCYQVNDADQPISDVAHDRADFGLPENAFVFCCFCQAYKIDRTMFKLWMGLLRKVPGSVLWLYGSHDLVRPNLRREAAALGIAADRLVFATGVAKSEHLARIRLADLALDTRLYGGHTTTSDILWAGVPVITLGGGHFASRVSASILTALGLADLVTDGAGDYESLALRLAGDAGELAALRQRIAANRLTAPLFDTKGFVGDMETAFARMWETHRAGKAPAAIDVAASRRPGGALECLP